MTYTICKIKNSKCLKQTNLKILLLLKQTFRTPETHNNRLLFQTNHHEEAKLGLTQFNLAHQNVQVVPLVSSAVMVEVERLVQQILSLIRDSPPEIFHGLTERHGE